MLSYVLFSYAAFHFPIHTLRLLHPLTLASQLTLCTPFASVLSGISTNSLPLASLCLFPSFETRVPKRPWPGSRRPFPRNYPLKKKTNDTLMYPTMPRLSRHCLWFGRYLRPFVHDTTIINLRQKSLTITTIAVRLFFPSSLGGSSTRRYSTTVRSSFDVDC